MIELRKVSSEERNLLWNIHQKYLYEMTNYYDDEMDDNGNYHYGYFDAYFEDPERITLFIYSDNTLVEFAMINPYSYIGGHPDHVLAEFTIFPMFRKKHIGLDAAAHILESYKGSWEIKYNEKNAGAKALWNKVTANSQPVRHKFSDDETVLSFSTLR